MKPACPDSFCFAGYWFNFSSNYRPIQATCFFYCELWKIISKIAICEPRNIIPYVVLLNLIRLFVCMHTYTHYLKRVWRWEVSLTKVNFLYHVGLGHWIRVIRLGNKSLPPLRHLIGPSLLFISNISDYSSFFPFLLARVLWTLLSFLIRTNYRCKTNLLSFSSYLLPLFNFIYFCYDGFFLICSICFF